MQQKLSVLITLLFRSKTILGKPQQAFILHSNSRSNTHQISHQKSLSKTFVATNLSQPSNSNNAMKIRREMVHSSSALFATPQEEQRQQYQQQHVQETEGDNGDNGTEEEKVKIQPKTHCMTVCMVPPSRFQHVWETITKARIELKDPGLYRWPPHANILYPFFHVQKKSNNKDGGSGSDSSSDGGNSGFNMDLVDRLKDAVEKCEPFHVQIDSLDTFGGKNRGVLYLKPDSYRQESGTMSSSSSTTAKHEESQQLNEQQQEEQDPPLPPLIHLQSLLEKNFPECPDQRKGGTYTPHMTISHFTCLDEALEAQQKIEEWWNPIEFLVDEVYVLKRSGDGGQFEIVVTLPLGNGSGDVQIHEPPLAFPGMPEKEEDWVLEERMKLKERRNGNGRRGRRRGGARKKTRTDRGHSRSVDTPEEIAQKRAERAAKRERLAREVALLEQAIEGIDME